MRRQIKQRSKRSCTDAMRATAYHEAGHVVASILNNVPFRSVTIVPQGDSLGCVSGRGLSRTLCDAIEFSTPTYRQRERLEREIMCLLAGHIAERRYVGRRNHRKASSDYPAVVDIVIRMFLPNECEAFTNWLYVRTENQITSPRTWPLVTIIAETLLERKTLKRKEVYDIWRVAVQEQMMAGATSVVPVSVISDVSPIDNERPHVE